MGSQQIVILPFLPTTQNGCQSLETFFFLMTEGGEKGAAVTPPSGYRLGVLWILQCSGAPQMSIVLRLRNFLFLNQMDSDKIIFIILGFFFVTVDMYLGKDWYPQIKKNYFECYRMFSTQVIYLFSTDEHSQAMVPLCLYLGVFNS